MERIETPKECAENYREWMVANAIWPMLYDSSAVLKLETIIAARDAFVREQAAEDAVEHICNEPWSADSLRAAICRKEVVG